LGNPCRRHVVDAMPAIHYPPVAFVGDYCTTVISDPAESSSAYPRSISPAGEITVSLSICIRY
jgi:hypothetical protein